MLYSVFKNEHTFEYKSGVYQIINKLNNKIYIGSSVNLKARWSQHRSKLRGNKHDNSHLQKSWNKYGESNFDFEAIEFVDNVEDLRKVETYWVIRTDCTNKEVGYNNQIITYKGNVGLTLSDETKKKISESNKGDKSFWYGKKFSELHKLKLSKAKAGKIGRKQTEETKKKISESQKGEKGYWYGKKFPKETLEKLSKARSGIKSQNYGKKMPEETKQKISKTKIESGVHKGEKHPSSKLSNEEVILIKILLKYSKLNQSEIGNFFGVSRYCICDIKRGKSWGHINVESLKITNEKVNMVIEKLNKGEKVNYEIIKHLSYT